MQGVVVAAGGGDVTDGYVEGVWAEVEFVFFTSLAVAEISYTVVVLAVNVTQPFLHV